MFGSERKSLVNLRFFLGKTEKARNGRTGLGVRPNEQECSKAWQQRRCSEVTMGSLPATWGDLHELEAPGRRFDDFFSRASLR